MQQNQFQQPYRKPKTFWSSFFGSCLGVLVAGVVCTFILMIGTISFFSAALNSKGGKDDDKGVKNKTVLHLKLDYNLTDRTAVHPFADFDIEDFATKPGLTDLIKTIRYAATDDRIKGIYLDASVVNGGMASLEELRKELEAFKKSGKFIYAYSEYYSQKAFYLASVADSIYVHPLGGMEFKGLAFNLMFYKNMLDKIGVHAEIFRPTGNKYKSAVEPFFLDKASDANRAQLKALIDDFWVEMLEKFSVKTGLDAAQLNEIANTDPYIESYHPSFDKFLTKALYYDEFIDLLKTKASVEKDGDLSLVTSDKYFGSVKNRILKSGKDKIAIIYAEGEIVDGKGSKTNVGGDTYVKALKEAREDKNIKAVILRVNSPGGSAMASEIIWREVMLTKAVKPVIVSMGNYAASGGYYISCAADTIIADELTLTGSIGVFSVAFNVEKLLNEKIGITTDTVKTNKFSDFPNMTRTWTEEERNIYQRQVDRIYATFLKRVSEGRGIPVNEVDSMAQGRVWTGTDALELGLVDMIGNMDTAMAIARQMIKSEDVEFVVYPRFEDSWNDMFDRFSMKASEMFVNRQAIELVKYYEFIKDAQHLEGHQARIPYVIEIY